MGAFGGLAVSIGGGLLSSALSDDAGDAGGNAAQSARAISQEGIDEIRKQLGLVQGNVQPFVEAGQRQIPGVERAASVQGLDEILGEIFQTDTFRNLVSERRQGVEGALSSGGFSRSGRAIDELSAVPQDIGLLIENLISGRQSSLAAGGQSAALNLGGLGLQGAANIGGITTGASNQAFQGLSSDRLRQAESQNDLISGLFGAGGSVIGGLQSGGFFNSDPWLKENKIIIGTIGQLNLYQWDWIPEVAKTFIGKFATIGFMADEVKKLYPDHVKPLLGFDAVHYSNLLDEIESENELAAA